MNKKGKFEDESTINIVTISDFIKLNILAPTCTEIGKFEDESTSNIVTIPDLIIWKHPCTNAYAQKQGHSKMSQQARVSSQTHCCASLCHYEAIIVK